MKSFVITVLDDVCAKNNKDPEALHLIEAARSYGKVEAFEVSVASVKKEYEDVIANLRTQLAACAENAVTPAELEILRLIRKKSALESAEYEKTIADRDQQLMAIKAENETRIEQIKNILGA